MIPTFNRVVELRRALESVLRQTRPADEIIVVDDGSTDGTRNRIGCDFPAVKVLFQENRGVSSARNLGIAASCGAWIAFLDSDDAWLPGKLDIQLKELALHPEYKICHCDEIWIRSGVRVNPMKKHRKRGGWIFAHCLPICAISPSAAVLHRSVLDSVGLFDESLAACEDYDLWLRITSRYPVLYIDRPLIIKTGGHADQLSARYWGMDRFRIRALEKIIAAGHLNPADHRAASEMLVQKARIFSQGAQKRNRSEDVRKYEMLCTRYGSCK
ncbi:MAG: glycosyltransferase family 2 protein [Methylococcaceae bacterium]|nr:glycosyltransferase family 2 protein [Methylococcaceae bacterium]MCI0732782.1 glycosyltransferase family 2 protein [Methylococcaceae bacterium]